MTMHRTFALLLWASGVAACATATTTARPSPTLRLQPGGVSPREPEVSWGGSLRVINDDVRTHEIYSSDCRDLATTPLRPGQIFFAELGGGPKDCHFQDLQSRTAEEYWGTVRGGPLFVRDPVEGL